MCERPARFRFFIKTREEVRFEIWITEWACRDHEHKVFEEILGWRDKVGLALNIDYEENIFEEVICEVIESFQAVLDFFEGVMGSPYCLQELEKGKTNFEKEFLQKLREIVDIQLSEEDSEFLSNQPVYLTIDGEKYILHDLASQKFLELYDWACERREKWPSLLSHPN